MADRVFMDRNTGKLYLVSNENGVTVVSWLEQTCKFRLSTPEQIRKWLTGTLNFIDLGPL